MNVLTYLKNFIDIINDLRERMIHIEEKMDKLLEPPEYSIPATGSLYWGHLDQWFGCRSYSQHPEVIPCLLTVVI